MSIPQSLLVLRLAGPCRCFRTPPAFAGAQTISSTQWVVHHFDRQSLAVYSLRIVVEPSSVRGLAADCPLLKRLGFNLAPSLNFFLLSQPSRLGILALHCGIQSFRGSQQFDGLFFEHLSVNGSYVIATVLPSHTMARCNITSPFSRRNPQYVHLCLQNSRMSFDRSASSALSIVVIGISTS